jgi:hypothetical protein
METTKNKSVTEQTPKQGTSIDPQVTSGEYMYHSMIRHGLPTMRDVIRSQQPTILAEYFDCSHWLGPFNIRFLQFK